MNQASVTATVPLGSYPREDEGYEDCMEENKED